MPVLGQCIISEYLWSETTTLQLTLYLWDSSVANSCGQEQKINNVNSFLYITCTYRGLQVGCQTANANTTDKLINNCN